MIDLKEYAPFVLRLGVGATFLIAGILKLLNTKMIIGLLRSIDFPLPSIMGIVLLLVEIVFGLAILAGYKLKYTVWPLVVVLLVAILGVHIPGMQAGKEMAEIMILFHVLAITVLISLFLSGSGALAFDGETKVAQENNKSQIINNK